MTMFLARLTAHLTAGYQSWKNVEASGDMLTLILVQAI